MAFLANLHGPESKLPNMGLSIVGLNDDKENKNMVKSQTSRVGQALGIQAVFVQAYSIALTPEQAAEVDSEDQAKEVVTMMCGVGPIMNTSTDAKQDQENRERAAVEASPDKTRKEAVQEHIAMLFSEQDAYCKEELNKIRFFLDPLTKKIESRKKRQDRFKLWKMLEQAMTRHPDLMRGVNVGDFYTINHRLFRDETEIRNSQLHLTQKLTQLRKTSKRTVDSIFDEVADLQSRFLIDFNGKWNERLITDSIVNAFKSDPDYSKIIEGWEVMFDKDDLTREKMKRMLLKLEAQINNKPKEKTLRSEEGKERQGADKKKCFKGAACPHLAQGRCIYGHTPEEVAAAGTAGNENKRPTRPRPQGGGRGDRPVPSHIKCYNCGANHYQSNCPAPRREPSHRTKTSVHKEEEEYVQLGGGANSAKLEKMLEGLAQRLSEMSNKGGQISHKSKTSKHTEGAAASALSTPKSLISSSDEKLAVGQGEKSSAYDVKNETSGLEAFRGKLQPAEGEESASATTTLVDQAVQNGVRNVAIRKVEKVQPSESDVGKLEVEPPTQAPAVDNSTPRDGSTSGNTSLVSQTGRPGDPHGEDEIITAYIDSGATAHNASTTVAEELATGQFREVNTRVSGCFEGKGVPINRAADLLFPVVEDGSSEELPLNNTLVSDAFSDTIVSMGVMTGEGYIFLAVQDYMFVYHSSGSLVKTIRKTNNMYPVTMAASDTDRRSKSLLMATLHELLAEVAADANYPDGHKTLVSRVYMGGLEARELLHQKLGHLNLNTKRMRSFLEKAFGKSVTVRTREEPCRACLMTMSHKFSAPKDTMHRRPARQFLDRVHVDSKKVMHETCTFLLDEATDMCWLFFNARKSDIAHEFPKFLDQQEKHARTAVKEMSASLFVGVNGVRQFRTDGAKEFVQGVVKKTCDERGIRQEVRVPHEPFQSGRIENVVKDVSRHGNAMVVRASLPPEDTKYAMRYFAEVIRRKMPFSTSRSHSHNYNTPFEAYHQVVIDPKALLDSIHTFGCEVKVHIQKALRQRMRLGPNIVSLTGTFLGEPANMKGFLVRLAATNDIVVAVHVVFLEASFLGRQKEHRLQLIRDGLADPRTYPVSANEHHFEVKNDCAMSVDNRQGSEKVPAASDGGELRGKSTNVIQELAVLTAEALSESQKLQGSGGGDARVSEKIEVVQDLLRKLDPVGPSSYGEDPGGAVTADDPIGEEEFADITHSAAANKKYEVEEILESMRGADPDNAGKQITWYKVRWANHDEDDDSWEPSHHLGAGAAVEAFKLKSQEEKAQALELKVEKQRAREAEMAETERLRAEARGARRLRSTVGAEQEHHSLLAMVRRRADEVDAQAPLAMIDGLEVLSRPSTSDKMRSQERHVRQHATNIVKAAAEESALSSLAKMPKNEREMQAHPHKELLRKGGLKEIRDQKKMGTLKKLWPRDEVKKLGKVVHHSKMLHQLKHDPYYQGGELGPPGLRSKGRLTLCGYDMIYGDEYEDTACPSADMVVWRVICSIRMQITKESLVDATTDMPTAYLWKKASYRIFMEQPRGYEEEGFPREFFVWELGTEIYGSKSAGYGLTCLLSEEVFLPLGYQKVTVAPSLWFKITVYDQPKDIEYWDDPNFKHVKIFVSSPERPGEQLVLGRDAEVTYVLVQVDDFKIVGNSQRDYKDLTEKMKKYDVKSKSPTTEFIGAEEKLLGNDCLLLMAKRQVTKIAMTADADIRTPDIPMSVSADQRPSRQMCPAPGESNPERTTRFRQIGGQLRYIQRLVFPKLSFALGILSQYNANPGLRHFQLMKALQNYSVSLKDDALYYRRATAGTRQLVDTSDAEWATDKENRKSVDGYCIWLWGNLIDFGMKKQPHLSMNVFESELSGKSRSLLAVKFVMNVLIGAGIAVQLPAVSYCDNSSVIDSLKSLTMTSKAKHIDLRFFWVKEEIKLGNFELLHISSQDNQADALTKPLNKKNLDRLLDDASGRSITDVGRKMRRGEYVTRASALKNVRVKRPEPSYSNQLPVPPLDGYVPKNRSLTSVEGARSTSHRGCNAGDGPGSHYGEHKCYESKEETKTESKNETKDDDNECDASPEETKRETKDDEQIETEDAAEDVTGMLPTDVQRHERHYRHGRRFGSDRCDWWKHDNAPDRWCGRCDRQLSSTENNEMGHRFRTRTDVTIPVDLLCRVCRGVQTQIPEPALFECSSCGLPLNRTWPNSVSRNQMRKPRDQRRCPHCVNDEEYTHQLALDIDLAMQRRQLYALRQPNPENFQRRCPCQSQPWSGGHQCQTLLAWPQTICSTCFPCQHRECQLPAPAQSVGPMRQIWLNRANHCRWMCPHHPPLSCNCRFCRSNREEEC